MHSCDTQQLSAVRVQCRNPINISSGAVYTNTKFLGMFVRIRNTRRMKRIPGLSMPSRNAWRPYSITSLTHVAYFSGVLFVPSCSHFRGERDSSCYRVPIDPEDHPRRKRKRLTVLWLADGSPTVSTYSTVYSAICTNAAGR